MGKKADKAIASASKKAKSSSKDKEGAKAAK